MQWLHNGGDIMPLVFKIAIAVILIGGLYFLVRTYLNKPTEKEKGDPQSPQGKGHGKH